MIEVQFKQAVLTCRIDLNEQLDSLLSFSLRNYLKHWKMSGKGLNQ